VDDEHGEAGEDHHCHPVPAALEKCHRAEGGREGDDILPAQISERARNHHEQERKRSPEHVADLDLRHGWLQVRLVLPPPVRWDIGQVRAW
jgi:hypothetical protein